MTQSVTALRIMARGLMTQSTAVKRTFLSTVMTPVMLCVVMSSVTIPIVAAPILTTQNLLEMVTQMEVVGTKTEVSSFFC
jgi:hypothetical protein